MIFKRINKKSLSIIQKVSLLKDELLFYLFEKSLFKLFEKKQLQEIAKLVSVISAEDTLDTLESYINNNRKGVYMRFGDGDIFLSKNEDDGFQKSNPILAKEIEEALSLQGQNVLKCLAIHSEQFGFSEGMVRGNHKNKDKFALQLFKDSYKYFVGSTIYSPVALHFVATQNPERANQFLKNLKIKTSIFIGNENVKQETLQLLFGKKVIHIKTPSENAFSKIDEIEDQAMQQIKKINDFSVIVVAMGCSGRPLMKRIWKQNCNTFIFDFGSLLDGIEGNNSRTWLKINAINYSTLLSELENYE